MEQVSSSSSSPPKKRKEHHHDAPGGGMRGGPTTGASASVGPSSTRSSPYPNMPPFSSLQSVPQPYPYSTGGPIPGYGYSPHFPTPERGYSTSSAAAAAAAYHPRATGPPPPHMPQSYGATAATPGPMTQPVMYCQTTNLDGSGYPPHPGASSSGGGTFLQSSGVNKASFVPGNTTRSLPSNVASSGSNQTIWNASTGSMANGMPSSAKTAMRVTSNAVEAVSVMSASSNVSQKDTSDNALLAAQNKDKGRGNYRCGKCGVPKKGHICPYQPKLKRRSDEPPPEMRNIATQVEMDEFLVVRRLNLEIQGLPESYTAAPMGDVGAEVHPHTSSMVSQPPQTQQQLASSGMGPSSNQGGMHPQQNFGGNVNIPPNHRMMMQLQEPGMNMVGQGTHLGRNMGEKAVMGQSLLDVGVGGIEDGNNSKETNGAARSHITEIPSGGDDGLL